MSDIGIKVEIDGLESAAGLLSRLAGLPEGELLDMLGEQIWGQTKSRIEDEKTAPDGTPWKPNRAGTSTLYREGELSRSIEFHPAGSTVAVGSGLIYARIHQMGGDILPKNGKALKFWWEKGGHVEFAVVRKVTMPARPYLGLSDENRQEIIEATIDFIRRRTMQ